MRRTIIKTVCVSLVMTTIGCATVPVSRVVERADGLSSSPTWASLSMSSFDDQGKRYFVGYVEVGGEALKSAALNMADEKAMAEPFRSLVSEFLDQNQVAEDLSDSVGTRVISSTRAFKPPMPSLHIVHRYWETVFIEAGNETYLTLRVFALAEVTVTDLEKAKKEYLSHLSKDTRVQDILNEVGKIQRDRAMTPQKENAVEDGADDEQD